jgi:hypothetical protein
LASKICFAAPPACALLFVVQAKSKPELLMKKYFRLFILAVFACALAVVARAAEDSIVGKWKAEFDSQIGHQKYTFEFKIEEGKLTGKAISERESGTNEVKIANGKIEKDEISFTEPLKIQDNEVQVEYKGKISGDELKLHRKVGDFAEYDIVAKRVKESDAKSDAKSNGSTGSSTNAPQPPANLRSLN